MVLYQCAIDPGTGALSGCFLSTSLGDLGRSVVINPANTRIYWADSSTNLVRSCVINGVNGNISNCINAGGSGLTSPFDIAFNDAGSRIYITNNIFPGSIISCVVNNNGAISACVNSGATLLSNPTGIAIY